MGNYIFHIHKEANERNSTRRSPNSVANRLIFYTRRRGEKFH